MRKNIYKLLIALILSVFILACSGSSDNSMDEAEKPLQGNNAYAVLEGVTLGDNTELFSDIYKEIPLSYTPDDKLQVPSFAFASRYTSTSTYTYLVIPVTNTSLTALQWVRLENGFVLDGSGNKTHVTPETAYAKGSVGKVSSTIFTNTCLASGESGYFFLIIPDSWDHFTTFEFNFDYGSTEPQETYAKVIPQSYALVDNDLIVSFMNTGTKKVDMGYLHFVLLDSSDRAISWNLTNNNVIPSTGVLNVGESGSLEEGYYLYKGSSSKMKVFLDFDVFEDSASLSVSRNVITNIQQDDFATYDEYVFYLQKQQFEKTEYLQKLSE